MAWCPTKETPFITGRATSISRGLTLYGLADNLANRIDSHLAVAFFGVGAHDQCHLAREVKTQSCAHAGRPRMQSRIT